MAEGSTRRTAGGRRPLLLAFTALLLVQAAWWCATPLFRGPDEIHHVYRASAVTLGQLRPDLSAPDRAEPIETWVEADLVASAAHVCQELYLEHRPNTCIPIRDRGEGVLSMGSSADHYNPVYYLLVGLPALPFEGDAAVWVMRIAHSLLCALLMGGAWVLLTASARTRWPALGFLAGATPAVLFAGAVVAPNGVTFAAALPVWAALISARRLNRATGIAALAAGIGGSLLVLTHTTGPLWLLLILMAHLVFAGWRHVQMLLTSVPWMVSAAVVLAATVASVAWTLTAAANNPSAGGGEPLVEEVKAIPVAAHVLLWVFQLVGVMPNRFGILWLVVYALWLAVLGAFVAYAVRNASGRLRLAVAVVLSISILVPTAATVATYDNLGVAWQGRYGLPLIFGVVLLAGEALDRHRGSVRVVAVGVATLAVTQFLAVLCMGQREWAGPYDDGRPWELLLFLLAPALVAMAYFTLFLDSGRRQIGRTS